jgi:hypothetical protein
VLNFLTSWATNSFSSHSMESVNYSK